MVAATATTTEVPQAGVLAVVTPPPQFIVEFNVPDAELEKLRESLSNLTAETPAKYREVVQGIAKCRDLRSYVEKHRKELKEDSIKYGRMVDDEAKRITAELFAIENPLKLAKQAVDEERERVKLEREAEEERRRLAEIAAQVAAKEAEAARIKAVQDALEAAERERIKAEQAAEDARIAEERRLLEAEKAAEKIRRDAELAAQEALLAEQRAIDAERRRLEEERLATERAALEAERQRMEAEKQRIAQEDAARQAAAQAEIDAREEAERQIAERAKAAERQREEEARLAALRPDVEKLRAWVHDFTKHAIATVPKVGDAEVAEFAGSVLSDLADIGGEAETFCLRLSSASEAA